MKWFYLHSCDEISVWILIFILSVRHVKRAVCYVLNFLR